jgi:hypothetical protein
VVAAKLRHRRRRPPQEADDLASVNRLFFSRNLLDQSAEKTRLMNPVDRSVRLPDDWRNGDLLRAINCVLDGGVGI